MSQPPAPPELPASDAQGEFNANAQKLVLFKNRFGHVKVLKNRPEDKELSVWLETQRQHWDSLQMKELAWLFTMGVRFGPRQDHWISQMVGLMNFRAEYGHSNAPRRNPVYSRMASWISMQRSKRERFSAGQIRLLKELDFAWNPLEERHLERLRQLREFHTRFGHCNVPTRWPENQQFARWVNSLRSNSLKRPSWVVEELAGLNFDYRPSIEHLYIPEQRWEVRLEEVRLFFKEHGHFITPPNSKLCAWISKQRTKKELMSEARRNRLDEIEFKWTASKSGWDRKFSWLEKFYRENGHCNVPGVYPANPRLGRWVIQMRQKGHKLSPDKRARLDAIGFIWLLKGQVKFHSWDWWFANLVEFKKLHGHCNASTCSETDKYLGRWLCQQRMKYKRGKLLPEYKQKMAELGVVWEMPKRQWPQRFAELQSFKRIHGHCNVPDLWEPNPKLSRWVYRLRFRKNRLLEEQKNQLDELGFEWNRKKVRPNGNIKPHAPFIDLHGKYDYFYLNEAFEVDDDSFDIRKED